LTNKVQARQKSSRHSNTSKVIEQHSQEVSYEGMLPMASELAKYEDILPGVTERLMTMVEERHKHIMNVESIQVEQSADINDKSHVDNTRMITNHRIDIVLKYLIGGALGCGLLWCGFYAMNHGHDNVAMIIFGGGFLTAVSKFVSYIFIKDKSNDE
jgi:uncharacterized membrane protein